VSSAILANATHKTSDAITCNIGRDGVNNAPVEATASVAAGSVVRFMWTDWQSDHPGPSMLLFDQDEYVSGLTTVK
jgi:hypothetical protein